MEKRDKGLLDPPRVYENEPVLETHFQIEIVSDEFENLDYICRMGIYCLYYILIIEKCYNILEDYFWFKKNKNRKAKIDRMKHCTFVGDRVKDLKLFRYIPPKYGKWLIIPYTTKQYESITSNQEIKNRDELFNRCIYIYIV